MDAWGCYKPNNIETPNDVYPYSIQDETEANNNIQAWKLKAVDNPAGGRLEIVYEADRYETVQQRRAMRHFNIFGMVDLFRLLKMKELSTWNPGTAISDQYNFHHEYGDLDGFVNELGLNAMTNSAQKNVKKKLFKEGSAYYMEKFGAFDFEAVPQNAVIFKLDEAISGTTLSSVADQMVKDDYFKAPSENPNAYLKDLLLKVYVNIKDDEVVEELVPLIADISSNYPDAFNNLFNGYFNDEVTAIGVMPKTAGVDEYEYGYVIIDPINTGDREEVSGDGADKVEKGSLVINPMQLMSMQFARQFLLDKVYGSCDGCDTDLSIDWKVFFGQDMYEYMIKDGGYAQDLVTNGGGASKLSTMRLFEPDNVKFGGNARVKIIRYLDNWDQISGEYNSEYVWNYKYTKVTDGRAEETGVASFEGRSGADENTLYAWDSYVNLKKKFPDERKFTPTPIAEQLYPIPLVGYSHVEVDFSSAVDYGHSESEFHTYKEDKYRTKSESTGIDKDTYIKKRNILSGVTADLYGYTQGYVVQTNDFHGKPSETRLYDGQGELISRSSYDYFELGENVPMVDRRGIVTPENIAIEYDIHADARFVSDKTVYNGIDFGLEFLYIPPAGFCITPSFGFSRSSRERGFYSHALIKHINYSAVLKGITSEYLGSVNHAQNLLFDKYTGQPILTSLNDEFNDELFSMSYPSHWRYRELRERNKIENLGLTVTLDPNSVFIPTADDIITPGDFVRFNNGPTLYVAQNYPAPANDEMFFIDAQGVKFTSAAGTYIVDILISGRDNRLMEPMQKVVSKTSPFDENLNVLNPPTNILSSYAVNYRNRLNVACGIPCDEGQGNNNELTFGSTYNPYVYGIRGDLVVDAQLAWQDDRVNLADLHGIRRDGAFSDYSSFYDLNTTEERWVSIDNPAHPNNVTTDPLQKWRRLSEITTFDKFGKILESKDQIDVHSSILYGYSNKYTLVPVAQAVNARQSDIAFDGFEDYTYFLIASDKTCPPAETHFDFTEQIDLGQGIYVTHDEKHSGLASLQVPATLSVTVGKEVGVICSALDAVDSGPDDFLLDDECACILPFEPSQGKYILGAWIKQGEGLTGGRIVVSGSGLTSSVNMYPTGNILDGWQRVEGRFEITGVAGSTINVTLENQNPSDVVYFDDLRIHPFLAGMKTMVYDPKSLLPLATHDGYNFTTFYNYDENLNQVRVRVETIEGIRTVVENEFGGQKKY